MQSFCEQYKNLRTKFQTIDKRQFDLAVEEIPMPRELNYGVGSSSMLPYYRFMRIGSYMQLGSTHQQGIYGYNE